MRARIHRGAHQIGGSCVELESEGERIVLDVGLPLEDDQDTTLPDVPGLQEGGPGAPLCVVVSHSHPDHYGLAGQVAPDIPILIGEAAARILKEAVLFSPFGQIGLDGRLRDGESFEVGPFRVTPMLVDHSAFDAYALLIEAGGKRLLYSGDLRAHGRKGWTLKRLGGIENVDALLMEGTRVSASGVDERPSLTEDDVSEQCTAICRETRGAVLACYSAQNIDRLVSFYKAARHSGRDLVMDLYAASIARVTGNERIPQAEWEGVWVYVSQRQRVQIKRAKSFVLVNSLGAWRINAQDLAKRCGEVLMTFRMSMLHELERDGCLQGAHAIWSMWAGYLDREGDATRRRLAEAGIPLSIIHASGHATVKDLQQLAQEVEARRVVPIHTAAPERFSGLFERAEIHADGEWWSV